MKAEWEKKTPCVCDPEKGIVCMFHVDLDAIILREALGKAIDNGTQERPYKDEH